MYQEMQAEFRKTSPFVMLFQQTEVAAYRSNVDGLKLGPTSDSHLSVWLFPSAEPARRRCEPAPRRPRGAGHGPLRAGAGILTYLGLLAVTFFIGRVIPVDPVLAIVGDRAPEHVVQRVREELGLNQPLYAQFVHLPAARRCRVTSAPRC
jgi:hypothetical protein